MSSNSKDRMSYDFTGKRALVTGGSSGLGRATALRLSELGAKVFVLSNIKADLDSLKAEDSNIEVMYVDLLDVVNTRKAVKSITPIQLLVNCAGKFAMTTLLEASLEEFDTLFGVNVRGLLNVTQIVAEDLIKRGERGSIVHIGSITSDSYLANCSTYTATKYAVKAYTKCMAVEFSSKGIRVNSVNPTLMKTPMAMSIIEKDASLETDILARTPLNKVADLQEVVNAIVFLLSDYSAMVTGHELFVDGGFCCT